jgi:HSP20 family protein
MNIIPWRNKGEAEVESTGVGVTPFRSGFDQLAERFFDEPWGLWPAFGQATGLQPAGFLPSLDVAEGDDEVVVQAELPGLDAEDIDIQVSDDVLTITGEKKARTEQRSKGTFHSERRYGRFRRSVRLPSRIDAGKVSAGYAKGVLTVRLPLAEEARPRRIAVKPGR